MSTAKDSRVDGGEGHRSRERAKGNMRGSGRERERESVHKWEESRQKRQLETEHPNLKLRNDLKMLICQLDIMHV